MQILIIEDNLNLCFTLKECLAMEGFTIEVTHTYQEALRFIQKPWNLILLDIGLPDGNGLTLAKHILKSLKHPPAVIFLTAQSDVQTRIEGLEMGASDYMAKPFSLKELSLRIKNVFKKIEHYDKQRTQVGKAFIDFEGFYAIVQEAKIPLNSKEIGVLKFLLEHQGSVVSRDAILDHVWSENTYPSPRTVDNFIVKLRKIIEHNPNNPSIIRSIRGVGYQLIL
jgi:two-component system alkaline phosphatase synthesis response regulator PhoP